MDFFISKIDSIIYFQTGNQGKASTRHLKTKVIKKIVINPIY